MILPPAQIKFGDYFESEGISVGVTSYIDFVGFDVRNSSEVEPSYVPANISVKEARRIIEELTHAVEAIETRASE